MIGKCAFQNISIHKLIPKRELKNRSLKSQISMGSSLTPLGEKWSLAVEYANPKCKFWIVLIYLTCPVQIQASIASGYFQRMKLVGLLFQNLKYTSTHSITRFVFEEEISKKKNSETFVWQSFIETCAHGVQIFSWSFSFSFWGNFFWSLLKKWTYQDFSF